MSVCLSAGKQILYSNLFTLTAFIQKILAAVVRQQHLARQVEYLIEFISPICIYLFQGRCDLFVCTPVGSMARQIHHYIMAE